MANKKNPAVSTASAATNYATKAELAAVRTELLNLISAIGPIKPPVDPPATATNPFPPVKLTAIAGDKTASLNWALGADGGSPVEDVTVVDSTGVYFATVPAATTNIVMTGLVNDARYSFSATARNAVGVSAPSTPIAVTPHASVTPPVDPPVTPPANASGFFGIIGADTKANVPVHSGQKSSIFWRATTSSKLVSVKFPQRTGPGGYSSGDGGTLSISLQTDNAGKPSGTMLATASLRTPNSGVSENFVPVMFSPAPDLVAGKVYHLVFENPSASNYISINNLYVFNSTVPRQPMLNDADYGVIYGSSWGSPDRGLIPVLDATYANGVHDGQGYYESMIDKYATIKGAQQARETFLLDINRVVTGASVRVRRGSGSGPLTITLETATGTFIDSVSVPSTAVPQSAAGSDNGGSVWAGGPFKSSRPLIGGTNYVLRLSTDANTTYTAHPLRRGTAKGLLSKTVNGSGQQGSGSNWTDLYPYDGEDLQFFLKS